MSIMYIGKNLSRPVVTQYNEVGRRLWRSHAGDER